MSKIDTSDEFDPVAFNPDSGNYSIWYNNKEYSYFTSEAGARAYLEVLRNGSDEIVPAAGGTKEEEIRTVPKVHGVLQGAGSAGSAKPRKRTYPELL